MNKVLFSSYSVNWRTPKELYDVLNKEFNFNDDPCPYNNGYKHLVTDFSDGLKRKWGTRTFMNPPYGRKITDWIRKAYEESKLGKLIVCLLPSRTDTFWWHEFVMKANEIRFIRRRLKFSESNNSATFPSVIVIFKVI